MNKAFAISPVFLAAALSAAQADDVPTVAMSNNAMVFQSPVPRVNGNMVSFSIDASNVNAFNYATSDKIAIIPEGESKKNFKACPYLPYKKNGSTVEKATDKPGNVMNITTHLTKGQMEAVKTARCVITDWPPLTDILGLK